MNAAKPTSIFESVQLAPRDPTIGVQELFEADPYPGKINLGVGVYKGTDGTVPLLECIQKAEALLVGKASPRTYLPIDGWPAYIKATQELVFGPDSVAVRGGRVITMQSLGGTGALKIGADLLKLIVPGAGVWVSSPTWDNHRGIFAAAGFQVNDYPYYDPVSKGVDFAGLLGALNEMRTGDIVLLHACCHNPTGADLSESQWSEVIRTIAQRGLIPFLDMAYQGFGDGIDADGMVVRRFAETGGPLFVATSFSKSFSLYGERVGALSVVTGDAEETPRVLSQLKRVVRTNYSNPPSHGAKLVATVLATPNLRALWESELAGIRTRIRAMRGALVKKLAQYAPEHDFGFIDRQRGMFSYSGLSAQQVEQLRDAFSIYAIGTGRICIASINDLNVDRIATAITTVVSMAKLRNGLAEIS